MSLEDTLVLHKKEKGLVENEAESKILDISTATSTEKRYLDKSIMSQVSPPTSVTSQEDHGEDRQERDVQRVVLEANFADNEFFFSSSESDISNGDRDDRSDLDLNFLERFSTIPDLDAISVSSTQQKGLRKAGRSQSGSSINRDRGKFVDPLTGKVVVEEMPDQFEEEIEEGQAEGESDELTPTEELSDLIFSMTEDSEMAVLLETPAEQVEVKVIADDEAFDDFLMQDAVVEHIPSSVFDKEALELERLHQLKEETEYFLTKLINQAVARAEYKDPMIVLRERLDKFALMEEIFNKLAELEVERKTRFNLNRKIVEYYKRKKSFKALTETPPEDDAQHIAKLNEATQKLDQMLSIEDYIKEKFDIISKSLRAQKIELQQANITKEREFDTLVRATLIKNNSGRLAVVIPQLIEELNTFRGYISDSRLQLIQYQHTSAVLQKTIDDFENQFRIREYMALQTETTELDKKIEERNADLENFRRRCNTDIHAFTHIKEKVDILRLFTHMKKKALAVLQADKKQVRERVVSLKVDRTNYQKEIRELTFQTGLLSKPGLLRDYDNTVKQLADVRKRVEQLRRQRAELTEKINKLEKKYNMGYISTNAIKIK